MIYGTRATIVCPADMMADGNQLALAIGESASDDQTFTAASWQDAAGNLYAVSSTVVPDEFLTKAVTPLKAPPHAPHVDLGAASRAQAFLYTYGQHGTGLPAPGRFWVFLEPEPGNALAAIAAAGLERIIDDI